MRRSKKLKNNKKEYKAPKIQCEGFVAIIKHLISNLMAYIEGTGEHEAILSIL
jgi:hypothetical protein